LLLAEERDESNQVLKRYFAGGEQRVLGASASYFYARDHLGSIREMTDQTGIVHARYDYDPWGIRTKASGDLDADFGFTGHFYHTPSHLHLAPYRAYSTTLGRWMSRDPIEEKGGANLYEYGLNNPVDNIDLLGEYPIIVVVLPNGSSYVPQTTVKNSAQSKLLGLPVGANCPVAVPPGKNPQDLVDEWGGDSWFHGPAVFGWAFRGGGPNDYKLISPIYDPYGNFMFGASGAAYGYTTQSLTDIGDAAHKGQNNPINTTDIQSGANAINNGGKLTTKEYNPPAR
jgi:RHS repeat-associated protein